MASSSPSSRSSGSGRRRRRFAPSRSWMTDAAVVWFGEDACHDVACAGGKGASLAAMTAAGLPVPPGFVVPASVLERSVDAARLRELARAGDHGAAEELVRAVEPPRA